MTGRRRRLAKGLTQTGPFNGATHVVPPGASVAQHRACLGGKRHHGSATQSIEEFAWVVRAASGKARLGRLVPSPAFLLCMKSMHAVDCR